MLIDEASQISEDEVRGCLRLPQVDSVVTVSIRNVRLRPSAGCRDRARRLRLVPQSDFY